MNRVATGRHATSTGPASQTAICRIWLGGEWPVRLKMRFRDLWLIL
jgi:hypothetical protein